MIFNTHSHINDSLDKAKELIDKCNELNVTHIAVIGYDINSSLNALKLAKEYPNIHAVCGIQPEEIDTFDDNYDPLIKMWKDKDCVAIGEIGLDYYWTKENKERQKEIFEKQIQYAISLNKPIAIHCRDAHQDTYDILSKYSDKLVRLENLLVLQCFAAGETWYHDFEVAILVDSNETYYYCLLDGSTSLNEGNRLDFIYILPLDWSTYKTVDDDDMWAVFCTGTKSFDLGVSIKAKITSSQVYLRDKNGEAIEVMKQGSTIEIIDYNADSDLFMAIYGTSVGYIKGSGLDISKDDLLRQVSMYQNKVVY